MLTSSLCPTGPCDAVVEHNSARATIFPRTDRRSIATALAEGVHRVPG
ncbi:hypothetical protein [Actinotalea ferrariae]|nr:hypothetical protein [Actinotalea ferrariae]